MAVENDEYWKGILGTTATITTICQFLSGMFTVHKIVVKQHGSVGDLSVVPFLMGTVGCFYWMLYGYLKHDSTLVSCNFVGTVLMSFYVLVFMRYTISRSFIYRQVTLGCVLMCVGLLYVNKVVFEQGDSAFADASAVEKLGSFCVLISILSCASPLVALKDVIRTKSSETLPFPLIMSMFLVCSLWWGYGVLAQDFYMQCTNCLGTVLASLQLSLFVIFPRRTTGEGKLSNGGYVKMQA